MKEYIEVHAWIIFVLAYFNSFIAYLSHFWILWNHCVIVIFCSWFCKWFLRNRILFHILSKTSLFFYSFSFPKFLPEWYCLSKISASYISYSQHLITLSNCSDLLIIEKMSLLCHVSVIECYAVKKAFAFLFL